MSNKYKQLEKECTVLFEQVTLMRTQAFNLSQAASSGQEELSDQIFNRFLELAKGMNKQTSDLKRWLSEIDQYKPTS